MRSLKQNRLRRLLLCWLFLSSILFPIASHGADHLVNLWENIPCTVWCRGCSPTSASMVLGYWDPPDWDSAYFGYGRLTDYWQEISEYVGGGTLINVPNVLDELRIGMGTSSSGSTDPDDVAPGIRYVTNTLNGYNFSTGETSCETYFGLINDWCWDIGCGGIRDEINAGRPFYWSVGDPGHGLAAWGYTDAKFVITYNTWYCTARDDWYYNQYNNGSILDRSRVIRVIPGGGTWGLTDLTVPNGGETWYIGGTYTILWYEGDERTWSADLYYSTDRGVNWTLFTGVEPSSPGWKSYNWTIPTSISPTTEARIKIANWSGSSGNWVYQSGDGSKENFTLAACPTPSTPTLTSPANGATCVSTTPTLDWSSVSDATSYEVEISTDSTFTSVIRSRSPTSSQWVVSPALDNNTRYYWRVRAKNACGNFGNWSLSRHFSTTWTPSAPSLLSPANGATCVSTTPTLDWSSVSGADPYEVQVSTSHNFLSVIRTATPAGTSSQWVVSPALDNNTRYYWRVRAKGCGNWSAWSYVRSFTTTWTPSAPSLIDPANGATGVPTTLILDWSDVSGATSYEVQVCSDSGCASVICSGSPTTSRWVVSMLLSNNTQYWWRVRAKNACENDSPWTTIWSFTTASAIPVTPTLLSPPDGETGVSTTPTLDWGDVSGATSYDVQVCATDPCILVIRSAAPTSSQWTVLPALNPLRTYYWRVRAKNASGDSPWTEMWSFRTNARVSKLYMAVKGSTNNNIYLRKITAGVWGSWGPVSGATSNAPAMEAFNNRLYMAVKGATSNNIYMRSMNTSGVWSSWSTIPGGTTLSPALGVFNNRLYLFVKGATNNYIYYRSMDTSESWSSWLAVPGGATSHTPAVAVFDGQLRLFVKGVTRNSIYMRSMNTSGTWSSWSRLSGSTTLSPALEVFNDRLYLFVKGATNNSIYYRSMDTSESWSSWLAVPGGATSHTPALSVNPEDGMLCITVKGATSGNIFYRKMDAGGVWSSWSTMTGSTSDSPVLRAF